MQHCRVYLNAFRNALRSQQGRNLSSDSLAKATLARQLSEHRAFTVGQILKGNNVKINKNTVHENEELNVAANLMVKEEVGSLMVTSQEGTLTGILTERDYLRAHSNGKGSKKIKDIMTPRKQLITVTGDTSVTACVSLMSKHQFRHLPVLEGNVLVGMIGSRTLLVNFLQYHEIQCEHYETFLPYPVRIFSHLIFLYRDGNVYQIPRISMESVYWNFTSCHII